MQSIKYAVISAAGMGTRLGLNIPKCLIEIENKPIIHYLLELLSDIENIRVIVGFMELEVIECIKKIRPDVVFVRNPEYKTTSNSHSLWLGSHDIKEAFLAIDGDLIIKPQSFRNFLLECDGYNNLIGISQSKTEEAVFVEINKKNEITSFFRTPSSKFEWCGIACFINIKMEPYTNKFTYQVIEPLLPLKSKEVICFEIDTPTDLEYALKNFHQLI